jgi:hypothetical protein
MKKDKINLYQKLESIVAYIRSTLDSTLKLDCTNPLRTEFAITLATRLRVLLNDENKNKSLLSLLNIKKEYRFQGVKCDLSYVMPANMVFTSVLTSTVVSDNLLFCKANDFAPNEILLYTFDAWWNEIVIDSKHPELSQITRRDIILTLADKEGGAHVDETYDKAYYQARNGGVSLFTNTGEEIKISNDPYTESAIYIAQEFVNAYYIHLNLKPQTYSRINSRYKVLQLTYYREVKRINQIIYQKRYRFLQYDYGHLNDNIMLLFDYCQPASYRLLDLYKIAKSYEGQGAHWAMVVDLLSSSRQFIYLRSETCDIRALLLKKSNKYKIVTTEEEFNSKNGFTNLDAIMQLLSPEDTSVFKAYLSMQIIDEPV